MTKDAILEMAKHSIIDADEDMAGEALENAEGKKRKTVNIDKKVENIKDSDEIRKIFSK